MRIVIEATPEEFAAIFLKDAANYIRAQEARITEPVAWVTVNDVDADIEYWRQKYLKLDAMYDELEKEKIAIEQNLMDRT